MNQNADRWRWTIQTWQKLSIRIVFTAIFWWFIALVWLSKWACIARMPHNTHWEFNLYLLFLALITAVGTALITSFCFCIGETFHQPFVGYVLPMIICTVTSAGQAWYIPKLPERLKDVDVLFRDTVLVRICGHAGAVFILVFISIVITKHLLDIEIHREMFP